MMEIEAYKKRIALLESALKEQQKLIKQFKDLLDAMPDPVFMKDANMRWLYANPTILSLYGIDKANYIGKTDYDLIHPDYAQACVDSDLNTKNSKQIFKSEEKAIAPDGKEHFFEVFKAPYYENDEFHGLIGIGRDITETKEATAKLEEALYAQKQLNQHMKLAQMGEMIENIAHQWRQPLSVISSIASSTKVKHSFGVPICESDMINDADAIMKQIAYMNETINDFRNFLKEEKEKTSFLVTDVVRQSLTITTGLMKKYDIEIEVRFDDCAHCFGTKNELIQVLINIINNARDALVEQQIQNKKLIITTFEDEESVYVSIADNAGGIPAEVLPHVFDSHFTTKKENGTGIGLYMSKQIIENSYNGTLSATNVNGGAQFTIKITKFCEKLEE